MKESEPNRISVDARYRTMLILWTAQMMSLVMFFLLTQFVAPFGDQAGPASDKVLSFVFAAVATFSTVISFVVRSKFLQRSVERQDPALVQTALVGGCALCEVAALLGVVERFILPGRDYLLLLAISFVGMALHFPRRGNLLAASYKDSSYGAAL